MEKKPAQAGFFIADALTSELRLEVVFYDAHLRLGWRDVRAHGELQYSAAGWSENLQRWRRSAEMEINQL